MDKSYRWLQLRQADEQLKPWMAQILPARPACGWIQTIRNSLGMTAVALAQRLNMRSSSIHKFEQAEVDETISLASLRKIAAALDCELQYALVPKKSLETTLRERAKIAARQHLLPVSHSMSLEDQALPKGSHDAQVELLAQELLDGSWRQLW